MTSKKVVIRGPIRLSGAVDVKAQDNEGPELQSLKDRSFKMSAYTGAMVNLGFLGMAVFDLANMEVPREELPALRQHDPNRIAGVIDSFDNDGKTLNLGGRFVDTECAREIADLSDSRFPWQASVGLSITALSFVDEGDSQFINGRDFDGPFYKINSILKESSFVPLGADGATSAVALSGSDFQQYELEVEMSGNDNKPAASDYGNTVKELQLAFPNDASFVLDCISKGLGINEAKLAHYEIVKAEQAAAAANHQAEIAEQQREFEAKLAARQSNPPIRTGSSVGDSSQVAAGDQWDKLVSDRVNLGHKRHLAVQWVARNRPDVAAAMVVANNTKHNRHIPSHFARKGA